MPSVPVGASQLHVERRGEGDPPLLVRGMGANCAHWGEPFLRGLELLDGAGHLVYRERPERVALLVRDHAAGPAV